MFQEEIILWHIVSTPFIDFYGLTGPQSFLQRVLIMRLLLNWRCRPNWLNEKYKLSCDGKSFNPAIKYQREIMPNKYFIVGNILHLILFDSSFIYLFNLQKNSYSSITFKGNKNQSMEQIYFDTAQLKAFIFMNKI